MQTVHSSLTRPTPLERDQAASPEALPTVDLGPIPVAAADMRSALEFTCALIRSRGNHYVCFCEASLLSTLIHDDAFARTLGTAAAIFPDGIALLALARIRGHRLPARVSGPSFILAAAEYGVSLGWRHFLYGGAPGVAQKLAERLQRDYPGVTIAGTHCPPFRDLTPEEESETKHMIEASGADLVWVCLGSPKQERWCAEHLGRINVPLLLAVGAAFDFHTGARPWAPAWIRKIGMEWAFRTVTGGRRTFLRNLRCVSVVGLYILKLAVRQLLGKR